MSIPTTTDVDWIQNLLDDDGNAIVGATWDVSDSRTPTGAAWTPVITNPDADGNYRVALNFTTTGTWRLDAVPNADDGLRQVKTYVVTNPSAVDVSAIAAAVLASSVAGGSAGTVAAQLARISSITSSGISVVNPVAVDQSITLVNGASYTGADVLTWTNSAWSVLTPTGVTFTAYANGQLMLSTSATLAGTTLFAVLTSAQTATLGVSSPWYAWTYEVNATLSGSSSVKLVGGTMTVTN